MELWNELNLEIFVENLCILQEPNENPPSEKLGRSDVLASILYRIWVSSTSTVGK